MAATASPRELEESFVNILDTAEEYMRTRQQLSDALKQGLLDLAKAKYSMGPLGQQQYEGETSATTTVDLIEEATDDCLYGRLELRRQPWHSTAQHGAAQRESTPQPRPADSESSSSGQGSVTATMRGDQEGASCGGLDDDSETGNRRPRNPLHWFGVLVPRALRQSQSSFSRAVELSVQLANLQQRLRSAMDDMADLELED